MLSRILPAHLLAANLFGFRSPLDSESNRQPHSNRYNAGWNRERRARSESMRHRRLGFLGTLVAVIGAVCVYGLTATKSFVAVARAAEPAQGRTSPSDSSSVPKT